MAAHAVQTKQQSEAGRGEQTPTRDAPLPMTEKGHSHAACAGPQPPSCARAAHGQQANVQAGEHTVLTECLHAKLSAIHLLAYFANEGL